MARILVIDDEELIRLLTRQALEAEGHVVDEAVDGEEGMRKFHEVAPDAVITDILMPNKEGIETVQEIRKIAPDVVIIAMSGGGRFRDANYLDVAKVLGANAVLKKPFPIDELSRVLNTCLDSATA